MTHADEERMLELLRFALEREGVGPERYNIGRGGSQGVDPTVNIMRDWRGWKVFEEERGERRTTGRFASLDAAARFFFAEVVNPASYGRHLDDWKAARSGANWPPR
jgi:hypothetical protein